MLKERGYKISLSVIFVLGILFRCYVFFRNPSLWSDEVYLTFNIYEKSYTGLLSSLSRLQASPPGFTVPVKILLDFFSPAAEYYRDMILRIIPFISGVLSLPLFYYFSKLVFRNKKKYILAALIFFAFNPCAIIYCAQFKQYSTELLCAILLLIIFYKIIFQKEYKNIYAAGITIIPWFSYSSFFIIAAGFLSILIKKDTKLFVKTFFPFILSCLIYYIVSLRFVFAANYAEMNKFWSGAYGFLSLNHPLRFFTRFGELFAATKATSVIAGGIFFLFCVRYCFSKENLHKKILILIPILLVILASIFHKYAIQPRLILFLLPCFMIALSSIESKIENILKIILFIIMLYSLPNYYPEQTSLSYSYAREAAAYLKNNLKESDKIILNSIQSDYEIYLNKLNLDKSRLIVIPCRTEELEKCQSELKKLPEGSYYFLSIIAGVEEMTNIEGFETSRINLNFNPKWNKTLYFEKRY